jgi:hypothetical protein
MTRLTMIAVVAIASSNERGCTCSWPTQNDVRITAAMLKRDYPKAQLPSVYICGCDEIRFYASDDRNHERTHVVFQRVNNKWVDSGMIVVLVD